MDDQSTDTLDVILDAIDAGVIILRRDRLVSGWNAWMVSATALRKDQARDKSLTEIFPDVDLRRLATAVTSALDMGASSLLTHALHPALLPLKSRAGRGLLHDITVSPVGNRSEGGCMILIADVTMATRRERFLRERQNARYDALVEHAPDVILTLDGDGVLRLVNPAATAQFGYTASELIGNDAAILFDEQSPWHDMWRSLMAGEKSWQRVELTARRKDGTPIHFEASASRWQNDSRMFVTAILRDVSERRAAEAALRSSEGQARAAAHALEDLNATLEQRVEERTAKLMEAEEALRQSHKMEAIGQLTGGIAHDFNNLLQGIIGSLDLIQKRLHAGHVGDVGRFIQAALASANRASTLTHRLLAFSRQQPVDPRPVDSNKLIGTIEELLRRSIGANLKLKFEPGADLWLVRCDANQLENALLNLAINARDAMPDGGVLTIATSNRVFDAAAALSRGLDAGEHVSIAVSDTGIGMTPEIQARAFDPFFTTKPIGQGTGLGLSMIYGFVRQSEGSVRIESAVGSGTTIEICLPRFRGDLPTDIDETDSNEGRRTANEEVVLVVEDEDVVRLLVVEVLNELGYRPLEAIDGTSALRILRSTQRIDLLVTDIGLPDMNGRQVADAARTVRPNLKVLFTTGYADDAARSGFLEDGMGIISKPFTMDSLAAKVQEMIEAQARQP